MLEKCFSQSLSRFGVLLLSRFGVLLLCCVDSELFLNPYSVQEQNHVADSECIISDSCIV